MLDTIVLTLSRGMYVITDPDKFEPSARWAMTENFGGRGYITSRQNPTKKELRNGLYKPRLTLTRRINHTGKNEATMKVELSLPKLLFGNNFEELCDNDFKAVATKLQQRLKEMGVLVFYPVLINAPVSAIHYSRNIILTDGTTPHYYITKIKEANISLALDTNQSDFRNEGHSFKYHANSYEVAFYDKIKDIETSKKSEKRAIEKDNAIQLSLFENRCKPFEVLRMEVRLNKRQKLRQILKKVGYEYELTFQHLFNSLLSKTVLVYYLDDLESRRPVIIDYQTNTPKSLLADLIINNPTLGPIKILQLFGLKVALDSVGIRGLRVMLKKSSTRSWYRLIAESKKIKLPQNTTPTFQVIRQSLNTLEPVSLKAYNELINNDKEHKIRIYE